MKKKLSALILALVLCLSISAPAFAYEESVSERLPIGNYEIWSELYKNGSQYKATTWVQAKSGNIPANGVQVQAILYDSIGEVKSSGLSMLTSAYSFHVADTPYRTIREGSAYSQGVVYIRDSSGDYIPHPTSKALESNLSRSVALENVEAIRVNSKGETYGSLLMAKTTAEYPDLIAAVGTEGQSGYLRRDDLIAADDRCGDTRYGGKIIHLYDLDGKVIGSFNVEFSHTDTAENDMATVRERLAAGSAEEQELMALADDVLVDGNYPVNAKGQTYGPSILRDLLGYSPDLTPAVNDDGLAGYVRCVKELPISAEEMAILNAATSEPLYDRDGNVIGTLGWYSEEPVQVIGKTITEVRSELASGQQSK